MIFKRFADSVFFFFENHSDTRLSLILTNPSPARRFNVRSIYYYFFDNTRSCRIHPTEYKTHISYRSNCPNISLKLDKQIDKSIQTDTNGGKKNTL